MKKLSVVIPCYNEQNTLEECVKRVLEIADSDLSLDIIIVDDGSTDDSINVARRLANEYNEITFIQHKENKGKGASLRTGFSYAKGDYVAVQDSDLEYDPSDLKNLIAPLKMNRADVVIGSRFLTRGPHRVLYFWHSVGNRFLTFLSNMFTDLNLTDMESGYKIFKREIIQKIEIEENRFGFEPEIIAKISHMNLRIYEMGISYFGRTYEEGKKIGYKDGLKSLYCIFRYNVLQAPAPTQILMYILSSIIAVCLNIISFVTLLSFGVNIETAAGFSFLIYGVFNYPLLWYLFSNRKKRSEKHKRFFKYFITFCILCIIEIIILKLLTYAGLTLVVSNLLSSCLVLYLNFFASKAYLFSDSMKKSWDKDMGVEKVIGETN